VLFLDELPEFGPRVLEVMHQLIEDQVVTISLADFSSQFPTDCRNEPLPVQLIITEN
jgi:magnesium chelatase family protein